MKISDIGNIKEITVVQTDFNDSIIEDAYTSDLLSDVMANAKEAGVLITIQAHKNTLAVCKLLDISAVVICNSRDIDEDFLQVAKEEKIAVFSTNLNQFQVSIRVGKIL